MPNKRKARSLKGGLAGYLLPDPLPFKLEKSLFFNPRTNNEELVTQLRRRYILERVRRYRFGLSPLPRPVPITDLLPLDLRRLKWLTLELKDRQTQEARIRGGKAPKHCSGIQAMANQIVRQYPDTPARKLWDQLPKWYDEVLFAGYEIYRDGERLFQINDRTAKKRSITFRTFRDYLRRARS